LTSGQPPGLSSDVKEDAHVTREPLVGFAGLGSLGQAMALRLVETGWKVRVLDRNPERLDPLVEAGAVPVSPAELGDAEIICVAVPDDQGIRAVLDAGLLDRLGPEQTLLVHSTIAPSSAQELASFVKDRSGARYIDAPVSGGPERARRGQLTLLLGGTDDAVDRAAPLLADLGSQQFRLGPVGAASATKLANQLITFTALTGVHEAVRLAEAFGVDQSSALAAIATGTGDTWVGRNWGFYDDLVADYAAAGVPAADRPWAKDMWEVLAAAREVGIDLPTAALVSQLVAGHIDTHAAEALR
jgi:3-hydroxyisobutyrate dehydrogenase